MDKKEEINYNDREQLIRNLLAFINDVDHRYKNFNFGMSTVDVLLALQKCLTGKYGK